MSNVADTTQTTLDPKLKELLGEEPTPDRDYFYCASCSNVLGKQSDRFNVNGSFDHHFVNPYGIEFHLGCFRDALGCSIFGDPTRADTWFMGFQWRHASCADCNRHLGWYFSRVSTDAEFFYGLILDRIQHE